MDSESLFRSFVAARVHELRDTKAASQTDQKMSPTDICDSTPAFNEKFSTFLDILIICRLCMILTTEKRCHVIFIIRKFLSKRQNANILVIK